MIHGPRRGERCAGGVWRAHGHSGVTEWPHAHTAGAGTYCWDELYFSISDLTDVHDNLKPKWSLFHTHTHTDYTQM